MGHDEKGKVPAAAGSAGVAGVLGAVVGKLENERRQRREPVAQLRFGTAHDLLGSVM
jgi:hypothetical protein